MLAADTHADEWDLLISEFGLDSEPMPLPMSKADIKNKLLASRGIALAAEREDSI